MQPLISPPRHRFGPCLPAPRLFVPRLPRCGHLSLLPSPRLLRCRSLPLLLSPRLPRCCRLPLLPSPRLPRCGCPATAAFGYRSAARTATPPAWSEMPPRPALLLQFCPERRTARVPSAVLRNVAQPIPVPALPGAQKNGRNRTEVRPPPKSNQSVAAASPRQLFNPSGQCTRLKQTRSV